MNRWTLLPVTMRTCIRLVVAFSLAWFTGRAIADTYKLKFERTLSYSTPSKTKGEELEIVVASPLPAHPDLPSNIEEFRAFLVSALREEAGRHFHQVTVVEVPGNASVPRLQVLAASGYVDPQELSVTFLARMESAGPGDSAVPLRDVRGKDLGVPIGGVGRRLALRHLEAPMTTAAEQFIRSVRDTFMTSKKLTGTIAQGTAPEGGKDGARPSAGQPNPLAGPPDLPPASVAPGKSGPPAAGVRWALAIGVSDYKDSRIPPLRYAAADARAFGDWLISPAGGRFAPANVKLLLNQDATGANIRSALFEWLKGSLAEDAVTIYFAGHGSPESADDARNLYLLPYDTDFDRIAATAFPMWDIQTALERFIQAKKVIVIADACHAGGIGQSFEIARRANRSLEVVATQAVSSGLQNLSQISDGVCVISASSDRQMSQEGQQWGGGHGVFTHFLLKGLQGDADYNKDSSVSLGEIVPYLSQEVRRETANAQSPVVSGRYDPALAIGR